MNSKSEKLFESPKRRHSSIGMNSNQSNEYMNKMNSDKVQMSANFEQSIESNDDSIKTEYVQTSDENNDKKSHYCDEYNPNIEVMEQLKNLAQAFAKRGEIVKRKISQPLQSSSPEIEESVGSDFISSLVEEEWMQNMDITRATQLKKSACNEFWHKLRARELGVFEPQSSIYISWLFIVSLAFVYNAIVIFLRSVFPYETDKNRYIFFILDYSCDAIYVIDMIWFKMRLKYVLDGQWIEDPKLTRKNYMRRNRFIFDLLSLLPLDLFYFKYGFDKPLLRLLRLTRLLKIQTFWEFFSRIDAITKSPYLIRIIHTLIYKMYLIHLSTCAYYLMSWFEGFGSTKWTYDNKGNAYLRCFYFAFRTATSIGGRMPKPTNEFERIYMIFSWLMGVFVFALLIGQIRDIVATATQNKTHYRNIINQTVRYMRNLSLPHNLQKRVRLWLTFTWDQQKTFDENKILGLLPLKMRTDIALSVHYHTLSRVELFKDCDRTVLRDLVLKLKPVLFLPGDYICRKGEIGKEMYIVNKGQVYVMGGEHSNTILATLLEGSVFGEIAILGIHGFTRRTADVRSLGYSNLFVLSKEDLWDTLKYYPEYEAILKRKVRRLMKQREGTDDTGKLSDEIDVESIVHMSQRPTTPRLIHTIMQMVPPESRLSQMLSRSSSMTRSSASIAPNVSISAQIPTHQLSNVVKNDEDVELQQQNNEVFFSSKRIKDQNENINSKIINDIICDL